VAASGDPREDRPQDASIDDDDAPDLVECILGQFARL